MMQEQRISTLNDAPVAHGRYVLYWMQQSQRAQMNHALEYAIQRAGEMRLPIVVGFGLMDDYPEANQRHYRFLLQGLAETKQSLEARGIGFVIRRGRPPEIAVELAREAALVVCDRGYLQHQRRWRDEVADEASVRVMQVESDVVIPVEVVSDKAESAARTIRPKLARLLREYLQPLPAHRVAVSVRKLRLKSDVDLADVEGAMATLKLDSTVKPVRRFSGGATQAHKLLDEFLRHRLRGYSRQRSAPAAGIVSHMSPYLHFGQISALEIALAVMASAQSSEDDKAAFLEELVVRRELACNYTHYTPRYWTYEALPAWARRTLESHAADPRPTTYTRQQLESAQTDDPYWNAAMREMTATGYMHNYMRMYWGKCVLGWKKHPKEAFDDLIYLNNKHFLDGRDPNSYAGVAWCLGLHDRPWGEREVFGHIRYMNRAGLDRKFDMSAYVKEVDRRVANEAV